MNSSPPDPCICAQQMVCRLSMRSLNRSGCARARARTIQVFGALAWGAPVTCACILALLAHAFWRYLRVTCILALQICMPVFARACARSEAYKSFQSYACHLRNPAVQQATVEIRDTEFPAPPLDFWPLAARDKEVITSIPQRSCGTGLRVPLIQSIFESLIRQKGENI